MKIRQLSLLMETPADADLDPSLSDSFRKMNLKLNGLTRLDALEVLKVKHPTDIPSENLLAHAKLHCFAEMYAMQELEALTLLKLHRDLLAFRPNDDNVVRIVELVSFVSISTLEKEVVEKSESTKVAGGNAPGKGGDGQSVATEVKVDSKSGTEGAQPPALSLRRLVVEYVIDQANYLHQHKAFRKWILSDGERGVVEQILIAVAENARQQV